MSQTRREFAAMLGAAVAFPSLWERAAEEYEQTDEVSTETTLTRDQALNRAAAAEKEIKAGKVRGPLHGIPYGLKDLFDTRDIKTTWGSIIFKDRVPDRDATCVEKLNNAGAILIAKLTMSEFA